MYHKLLHISLLVSTILAVVASETTTTAPGANKTVSDGTHHTIFTINDRSRRQSATGSRSGHSDTNHSRIDTDGAQHVQPPQIAFETDRKMQRQKRQVRLLTDDQDRTTPYEQNPANQQSDNDQGQQQQGRDASDGSDSGAANPNWDTDRRTDSRESDRQDSQRRYGVRLEDRSRSGHQSSDQPRPQPNYAQRRPPSSSDQRHQQRPQENRRDPQEFGNRNLALEVELLRFSNERGVLANNQPCGYSGDCNYEILGSLDLGNRAKQPNSLITTTRNQNVADLNMKMRRTLCNLPSSTKSATLGVEVRTLPSGSGNRLRRQVREEEQDNRQNPDYQTAEPTYQGQQEEASTADFNYEESQNRIRPDAAEDQYSRDRYGQDRMMPVQEPSDPRLGTGTSGASGNGGELVNLFDCLIILALADQEQGHTAQWQTAHCLARYPNSQMELAFRYNAYRIEPNECEPESRSSIQWSPMRTTASL